MDHDFDHIADSYLAELRQELGSLPREQRREILDGVAEHIAEARAAGSVRTEAELRTLIDRLGSPEEIAGAAGTGLPPRAAAQPSTWRESAAVILLPIGGLVLPVIGWLVGLVLLWASETWSVRDKLIGTLIVPGGLTLPAAVVVLGIGAGGSEVLLMLGLLALTVAPLASAAYLAGRKAQESKRYRATVEGAGLA